MMSVSSQGKVVSVQYDEFFIDDKVVHVKSNKHYKILSFPRHSETLEPMVCYVDKDGQSWVRPANMFFDGRFKKVEEYAV